MSKAIKAALISAFVCPGGGHFYLKRYNAGTVISTVTLSGLAYLLYQAVTRARVISDQIVAGEIPLDFNTIYQLISTSSSTADATLTNLATGLFVGGWLVGVIDAYRVGTRLEIDANQPSEK